MAVGCRVDELALASRATTRDRIEQSASENGEGTRGICPVLRILDRPTNAPVRQVRKRVLSAQHCSQQDDGGDMTAKNGHTAASKPNLVIFMPEYVPCVLAAQRG